LHNKADFIQVLDSSHLATRQSFPRRACNPVDREFILHFLHDECLHTLYAFCIRERDTRSLVTSVRAAALLSEPLPLTSPQQLSLLHFTPGSLHSLAFAPAFAFPPTIPASLRSPWTASSPRRRGHCRLRTPLRSPPTTLQIPVSEPAAIAAARRCMNNPNPLPPVESVVSNRIQLFPSQRRRTVGATATTRTRRSARCRCSGCSRSPSCAPPPRASALTSSSQRAARRRPTSSTAAASTGGG
jgi:hypothetical protein